MGEYGSLIALLVDRCYPRLFRFLRVGRTWSLTTVGPGCPARLWGPQARGLGPGLFPLALLGVTVARVTAAGTAVTAVGALGTGLQGHGRARETFEFRSPWANRPLPASLAPTPTGPVHRFKSSVMDSSVVVSSSKWPRGGGWFRSICPHMAASSFWGITVSAISLRAFTA